MYISGKVPDAINVLGNTKTLKERAGTENKRVTAWVYLLCVWRRKTAVAQFVEIVGIIKPCLSNGD